MLPVRTGTNLLYLGRTKHVIAKLVIGKYVHDHESYTGYINQSLFCVGEFIFTLVLEMIWKSWGRLAEI